MDNLREEYDSNKAPDDVRYNASVGDFLREQKAYDPVRVPEEDIETELWENPFTQKEIGNREYGQDLPTPPLSVDDSLKFGGSAKPFKYN